MNTERKRLLVAVRLSPREHGHWIRSAAREGVTLPELCREAVRIHLRQLELLRLAGGGQGERASLDAVSGVSG
jgi:hypothetical protein